MICILKTEEFLRFQAITPYRHNTARPGWPGGSAARGNMAAPRPRGAQFPQNYTWKFRVEGGIIDDNIYNKKYSSDFFNKDCQKLGPLGRYLGFHGYFLI